MVLASTRSRCHWLQLGEVSSIEFSNDRFTSVTLPVADEYFLTVIVSSGGLDDALRGALDDVVARLREEAGY